MAFLRMFTIKPMVETMSPTTKKDGRPNLAAQVAVARARLLTLNREIIELDRILLDLQHGIRNQEAFRFKLQETFGLETEEGVEENGVQENRESSTPWLDKLKKKIEKPEDET